MQVISSLKTAMLCCTCAFLFSCQKNFQEANREPAQLAKNTNLNGSESSKKTPFYALTSANELVRFESGNPLKEGPAMPITGLQPAEKMIAIDFRPATGQLYGVTDQSRIYFINLNSGAATGFAAFTPAINGTAVGFDFNPTVDRIRLVTNTGQDLRLNPETGMVVAVDGAINPSSAMVTAVAYTNSFAGAASTTLFDIDVASDKLFIQNPPNSGTLVEVGALGVQAVGEGGFDIASDNSVAIAALFGRGFEEGQDEQSNGNKYRFYYIDLQTGKATNAGKTDREIIGLAIPTMPVAYATDNMNRLLIMNPADGSTIEKTITGLMPGDIIAGIDIRPATAQLYALTTGSRIYTINLANGAATAIGASPFKPMLSGTSFGFDFNPTVDRIRVVSNTGQNLRLNPITGAVAATDPALNPGMPAVNAAAYTNNFAGATTTTLYDLDADTDMLYQQNPANAGTLINTKPLGINISGDNGFDIGGTSGKAWAILKSGTQTGLYSINLETGKASLVKPLTYHITGFAVGLGF